MLLSVLGAPVFDEFKEVDDIWLTRNICFSDSLGLTTDGFVSGSKG